MDKLLEVRGTVMVTDRWYRDIGLEEKEQKKKKRLASSCWFTEGKESNNMNEEGKDEGIRETIHARE